MNKFQEKRAAKVARFKELAEKANKNSESNFKVAHEIGSFIPMGQPIMVGHHSEGRHRRDLAKIDSYMRRSVEENKKADYYERRAEAAENNRAIFTDDPEAVDKMRAKVDELRKLQEYMKRINKIHAAYLKNPTSIQKETDLTEAEIKKIVNYVPRYSWEKHPYAPYKITNNGANLRTAEKRLEELIKRSQMETKEVEYQNGIKVVENVEENRLQVFFPGKPDEETRTKIKRAGFRWSPTNGCWQGYLTNNSRWNLKHSGILIEVKA